jgi:hypothetical protein
VDTEKRPKLAEDAMRRGFQAFGIGLVFQVLLFGIGILVRTPQIPGHPPVLSPLRFFSMPGFVLSLLVVDSVHIMWSLHPVLYQAMQIAANVLFYSVVAYFVLWLRSAKKANLMEVRSEPGTAWYRTPLMRRVWLAVGIGAFMAALTAFMMFSSFTRTLPNGGTETMSLDLYHPWLMSLSLPGVVFFWIAALITDIDWNSHQLLGRVLVTVGDAAFYSVVAYVLMRLTAGLSERWKQR